ncbi:MAG: PilZ domain-containing protein [Thermodesulfobacteriota bacterium]|nr:PilZ domain-containing protein [Thermodesulfobacteriota bacterium]
MSEHYKMREDSDAPGKKKTPVGKRQYIRFQLMNSRVQIRKTGLMKFLINSENRASLVNLSRAGLQVLITEALAADEKYQVNLYVPGSMDPLIIKATVVWCQAHKTTVDKTYYRAGFMFTKLSDSASRRLRRLEPVAEGGGA